MSQSLLILSVGSNPLPNAIVASYLVANENRTDQDTLPSPDYVLFVYSSGTKKFKDNILKVVPMENNKNLDVGDDIRDYQKIENEVTNQLKRIIKEEGVTNIHVNYTGGTKTMAVAITTAVYKFSSNDNIETIFSDLDPDDFKIRLKNGDCYPDNKDLRNLVNISVDDLYCLHDLKKPEKEEKVCEYHTDDFREALRQECCDWVEAEKENRSEEKYPLLSRWEKNYDRHEACGKESAKDYFDSIEKFHEFKDWKYESFCEHGNKDRKNLIKEIRGYIRGKWLEQDVFQIVQSYGEGITDTAWNIMAKIEDRDFEVDVIAMKGCQPFLFSCTTCEEIGVCKGKAFEALYRASQLGGDQSKVVLVSLLSDQKDNQGKIPLKEVRKDMKQFNAEERVSILGLPDVRDRDKLSEQIKTILKNGKLEES